jgi:hypothetical protein
MAKEMTVSDCIVRRRSRRLRLKSNAAKCHDCDVPEGALHQVGCDMERCPFCGGQLISCRCLDRESEASLQARGRIPYIVYPNVCVKCGVLWPDLFMVADSEWKRYIEPAKRGEVICWRCWNFIKAIIDFNQESAPTA